MKTTTIEKEDLENTRKNQILDAAVRVFSRKGFAGALMEDIAKLAKLSKGSIYHYFRSKEEVFLSSLERGITALKDTVLQEVEKGKNALDKIQRAITTYFGFFENNRNLIEIVLHAPVPLQKQIQKKYMHYYHEYLSDIEEIFRQGVEEGQILDIPPQNAISFLVGTLNGLIYMREIEGRKGSFLDEIPSVIRIYFGGIIADEKLRKHYETS